MRLIEAKAIRSEGAILVEKDDTGEVRVTQTGDHRVRKGMGRGGGVGVLVGLAAPPLLGSIAFGAAAGGIDHAMRVMASLLRDGRDAADVMGTLAAEDAAAFASVPRNGPCPCGSGRKHKHCHGRAVARATPAR